MSTHSQLASRVKNLYREYTNERYYRASFIKSSKKTLLALIRLQAEYDNRNVISRPPTPSMQKPRGAVYDAYMKRMQFFFKMVGCCVSVQDLNVPQTEAVVNFLAGIKNPGDGFYEKNFSTPRLQGSTLERQTLELLSEYACRGYFPVSLTGLSVERKEKIHRFLNRYECRQKIRPPLPKNKKLFLQDYYQYRERAQQFFDKVGFPVEAAYLTLPMIEALLNFMVGHRRPQEEQYRKVFAANSTSPVHHFVSMYKPYENSRYPITAGQYRGKRKAIRPLLYFSPEKKVERWFSPPESTKIRNGRTRLFLNYRVIFDRLDIPVNPSILPIAYAEAVLNFARITTAEKKTTYPEVVQLQHAG